MSTNSPSSNPPVGTEGPPIPVTISVGPVGTGGTQDAFLPTSDTQGLDVWIDYKIVNRLERDQHAYMMGITSPGGFQGNSVAFVQLAAPTELWIADWTALRLNQQPPPPDPTPLPGWVLLDTHIETAAVIVGPDGITPMYRISGTYFYGKQNPTAGYGGVFNDLCFGRPGFLQDNIDRTIPTSPLAQSIITNVGQQAGQAQPPGRISPR